jgi:hypothetical protein
MIKLLNMAANIINSKMFYYLDVVVYPICHNVIYPFLMPETKNFPSIETSITNISF